jgi:FADH2 O2-dependent halogenase
MKQQKNVDYLIAGSGFAGSITALCLKSAGFSVCLIEKGEHPKFSIGESSTPIADMILRDLADIYDLPQLKKLSRYGSWQTHYPNVKCGLKRGFSYYKHSGNQLFQSNPDHSHELLVAASKNNENSDTQWYRPDIDQHFVQMVKDAGIDYLDRTTIKSINKSKAGHWLVEADQNSSSKEINAGFIIDATGSPDFSGRFFGTTSSNKDFKTNTRALYSHFNHVSEWKSYLDNQGFKTDDYPYNPDYSALHHMLEPGWLWMLRFNDGLLSAGLVLDGSQTNEMPASEEWHHILSQYPSLHMLFRSSTIAKIPGQIIKTGRLQRRLNRIYGDGWAALHHTAGFVDPLHSTGIAHSLAGVEKLLSILINTHKNDGERPVLLSEYQTAFFKELTLIDRLVAGCYKSRHDFDLFSAVTMLYFICSVHYEQRRLNGATPYHFLSAGDAQLTLIVQNCYDQISELLKPYHNPTQGEKDDVVAYVSDQIQPFNDVGLMEPSKKNMYEHTAVVI